MSRYIEKIIYLEKLGHLIIWNGESISHLKARLRSVWQIPCIFEILLLSALYCKKRNMTAFCSQGEGTAWVNVDFVIPHPSDDDWIGVFSPSNFKYACLHHLNWSWKYTGSSFLLCEFWYGGNHDLIGFFTFLQRIHMPWFSRIWPRSCDMFSTNKGQMKQINA